MINELALHVIRQLFMMGPLLQRGLVSKINFDHDAATIVQMRALGLISAGPLTISELSRLRLVSLQTTSELVKALEERHWVTRVRDPQDGRQWLIQITDEGLQQLAISREYIIEHLMPYIEQLTDEELSAIDQALSAFQRIFTDVPESN